MSNSEEKIKAFFSDEEKVKALASDEEFIEKVCGGTATSEAYKAKLGALGLELSDSESKEVEEAVNEFLKPQTVNEDILSQVAGGLKIPKAGTPLIAIGGAHLALNAAGLGCGIASLAYSSKANKALRNGDLEKSAKYSQTSKKLGFAAGGCLGVGASILPALVVTAGAATNAGVNWLNNKIEDKPQQTN